MKRLLLALALATPVFAQSFPSSVYTPLVAADNVQTQLTVAMGIGDTNVVVASTTGWVANMVGYICDTTTVTASVARCSGTFEVMLVTAVPSATTLTVTRAYGGTTAKAHASGKGFSNSPAAVYVNSAQTELQGIERVLGINAGNIVTAFNAQAYYWSPMTPGGSLAIGSNAVTLTPCPSGISATSINIGSLYITGGTGTAEGVPIVGFSSGTGNCSVTITAANTHTGAWTIGPSANGIVEAITAASAAGGGTVVASIGTTTVRHRLIIPSNVYLRGQGPSSVLKLPDQAWPATFTGPFACSANYACMIASVVGASRVAITDFLLDMNGANNSQTTNGSDIFLVDCNTCLVRDVIDIASHHSGGFGFSVYGSGTSKNNVWDHNTIIGYGSANSGGIPTCGGGIFVQSLGGWIINNYATNICDAAYIANGDVGNRTTQISDVVIANNTWIFGTSSAVLLGGVFSDESAHHAQFIGNTCRGDANEGCYFIDTSQLGLAITDALVAGNSCTRATIGNCVVLLGDGTHLVQNVVIAGGTFSDGILLSLSGAGSSGISDITITGVTINNCFGTGILFNNGTTHALVANSTITGCAAGAGVNVFTTNNSDIQIKGNSMRSNAGGDISDLFAKATICDNKTDGDWNGQCNVKTANYGPAALANGANQNVALTSTVGGASNTAADIQIGVTGPTGAFSIGGFATPTSGRRIYLTNTTVQTMTLSNEAAGSTAANRILTPTGADVTAKVAILMYSPSQARWIVHSYQ